MTAPVLLFGGCYSNLQATRALLAEARRLGIPPGRVVCTGDVVAYGADPADTVALVRAAGIVVVMGNCEEQLGGGGADCGCGFEEGSACDRLSQAWFRHADAKLGDGDRAWMRALPRRVDLVVGGRRLAVVHGTPERINAFVFPGSPAEVFERQNALAGADGVVGGHCGVPFTRIGADGALWHNPGAIGMPANDGTARGWFSVVEPHAGGLRVHRRALAYDHAAAAGAMRAAGLPEAYARSLEDGLWADCGVMPEADRARRGVAIKEAVVEWSAR